MSYKEICLSPLQLPTGLLSLLAQAATAHCLAFYLGSECPNEVVRLVSQAHLLTEPSCWPYFYLLYVVKNNKLKQYHLYSEC